MGSCAAAAGGGRAPRLGWPLPSTGEPAERREGVRAPTGAQTARGAPSGGEGALVWGLSGTQRGGARALRRWRIGDPPARLVVRGHGRPGWGAWVGEEG